MTKTSKAKNTDLFKEAEALRKSIQSEIHSSVRNEKDTVKSIYQNTSESSLLHKKSVNEECF
jgi:hypothetical protein